MDDSQDIKTLQDEIQASLITTTRTAGQIAAQDLPFHRSLDPSIGDTIDEQSARLLALTSALLKSAASIADLSVPVLEDADDVENNWRNVVDVVDSLLEKTDTSLDEYTGVRKRKETNPQDESLSQQQSKGARGSSPKPNNFRYANMLKPQLAFDVKPDNQDITPWKPLLTTKPHAIQSLKDSLGIFTNDYDQQQYRHPYETEILQLKYPDAVYQTADPIPYQPVETTSAVFVDTLAGVMEMLEELKAATEIAVDLEHHDQRSYVGLVSLMQISTREKDWIVDTLKPWRQDLQILNEVFADPKIIKVFHGAFMDIGWLQRDLGLYVVGLFDTHHASRTLGYQGGSLAFLLKKFINFDADKQYQMADWRIRPLPQEMFFYARADTHFLLFIYDCMRNELIEKSNPKVPDENRIEIVLQKSKEVSLIRHERQIYNAESGKGSGGWYSLVQKTPSLFSNEQFAVFKAVHEWRDNVARLDDDSPSFVMRNDVLNNIAKFMPLDIVALHSVVHPISHGVKSRTGELLEVIKTAKEAGKTGPSIMDVLRPNSIIAKANLIPATLQADSLPKTLLAVVGETELRSEESSFWGGAFGSSVWDQPTPANPSQEELHLPVPYPDLQMAREAFANNSSPALADRSKRVSTSPETSPTPTSIVEEEVFVPKRGSKRKSDGISEGDEPAENEISLNEPENEKKQAKAAKRAERRLRKEQKKAAKADTDGDIEMGDEAEPFDYSKAESVFNSKRPAHSSKKDDKQKKKPFDPYAKSADAPNGLRRLQTESAGKSKTFRS